MDFLAVIDHEHLDNGIFLTAFARSLSRQSTRGLIIHGDSAYTDRLIQTGMMREDAVVRAVKDLNHRLIALLADEGISAIGLNGYQRSMVRQTETEIEIDSDQLHRLPETPHLLLSSLALHENERIRPLHLADFVSALTRNLNIGDPLIFTLDDREELISSDRPGEVHKSELDEEFLNQVPEEFRKIPIPIRLLSARGFADFRSGKESTRILSGSS